jgi:hypothetical protein
VEALGAVKQRLGTRYGSTNVHTHEHNLSVAKTRCCEMDMQFWLDLLRLRHRARNSLSPASISIRNAPYRSPPGSRASSSLRRLVVIRC